MKATLISDILQELYDSRVRLSKQKFSGVYEVDGVYRVHEASFIPKVWNMDDELIETIGKVVDINFHRTMEWDAPSLWLTMKERE
jgi:hypothetical protein